MTHPACGKVSCSCPGDRLRNGVAASTLIACVALLTIVASSAAAHAQSSGRPLTIVFAPHTNAGKDAARVTREARSAIEKFQLGELLAEPALDLEALQLTIDCVGESATCLREVAHRSHAQIVIALAVERAHGSVALRALYFDADAEDGPRRVERRAEGEALSSELLQAVPDMLHELFGADGASEASAPSAPAVADDHAVETDEHDSSTAAPLGPLLLGAAGLAVVAAGFTVGALMNGTEDNYAARTVQTQMQADRADDDRKRGRQQALVANVLLGVGAAALLAGGIWLAADLVSTTEPQPQTALVPMLDTHSAGLSFVGTWGKRL